MFLENILRVSNACKGVLDCVWIKSRIVNATNRGFCLGVVTAMAGAVHRPGLSGDRLAEAESSRFEVVTVLDAAVHRPSLSDDRLIVAESSSFGVVTAATSVHCH